MVPSHKETSMARSVKHEQEDNTSVKTEPFKIEWPPELDIQPVFKVPVSKTREAWVYECEHEDERAMSGPRTGFKIAFVIAKTGREPTNDDDYHYNRHRELPFFQNLLDVRTAIDRYSVAHQPKVKTQNVKVKTVINGDEDEE
jgi:hypothetical protein